jgi:hypothetical protein
MARNRLTLLAARLADNSSGLFQVGRDQIFPFCRITRRLALTMEDHQGIVCICVNKAKAPRALI